MLLPSCRLHDRGNRCPVGLFEQGEDRLLFGPAAGRSRASLFKLSSPLWSLCRRDLRLSGCAAAVRHLAILSAATAHAPSPPKPHIGGIASGAGSEIKRLA